MQDATVDKMQKAKYKKVQNNVRMETPQEKTNKKMNEMINKLKSLIPGIPEGTKMTRVKTLTFINQYMIYLKQLEDRLQEEFPHIEIREFRPKVKPTRRSNKNFPLEESDGDDDEVDNEYFQHLLEQIKSDKGAEQGKSGRKDFNYFPFNDDVTLTVVSNPSSDNDNTTADEDTVDLLSDTEHPIDMTQDLHGFLKNTEGFVENYKFLVN